LSEQHGVIDTSQLYGFGLTWAAVRAQILAGRWQPVVPRVYATFTGPLPRESRISAALLYAGPVAVLSHRTAAELWRMRPESAGPVHVTVPYQCSAISQPRLVVVHRSRAFRNIAVDGRPPLTSRADTAVDLAVAEPSPREAQLLLTDLMTARRVAVEHVRRRLSERQPRRYKLELEQAVARVQAGVESMLEERYAVDVEVAHGLPAAHRQAPFRVDGRKLFEDAVYDGLGVPLTVRLDGRRQTGGVHRWDTVPAGSSGSSSTGFFLAILPSLAVPARHGRVGPSGPVRASLRPRGLVNSHPQIDRAFSREMRL